MKILRLALFISIIPFLSLNAKEKAEYNYELNKSIFPLQDQVRFYGKNMGLYNNECLNDKSVFAIYNLQEQKNKINFECIGYDNAECGAECFHDGIYIGKYHPEVECSETLIEEGYDNGKDFKLDKLICKNKLGKIIWQRNLHDKYVFNYVGNLIYLHNPTTSISYKNNTIRRKIVHDKNETYLYDADNPRDFFHVKYERDDADNIIREFHYNQNGFPYHIYEAEYVNDKCLSITKIDGYSGKREVYEFK